MAAQPGNSAQARLEARLQCAHCASLRPERPWRRAPWWTRGLSMMAAHGLLPFLIVLVGLGVLRKGGFWGTVAAVVATGLPNRRSRSCHPIRPALRRRLWRKPLSVVSPLAEAA